MSFRLKPTKNANRPSNLQDMADVIGSSFHDKEEDGDSDGELEESHSVKCLSLTLSHGDILIMQGAEIQNNYQVSSLMGPTLVNILTIKYLKSQHAVLVGSGGMRIAATARMISPLHHA